MLGRLEKGVEKARNCSRVLEGKAGVERGQSATPLVSYAVASRSPPQAGSRRHTPGSRPLRRTGSRLRPAPPPALAASPHPRIPRGASQWPDPRSLCARVREGLRTRKLRYRRASRGGTRLSCRGEVRTTWAQLKGAGGLLGAGVGCRTAPDSRGRAPRSSRSIRREPQDFKEESAADCQDLSDSCVGSGVADSSRGDRDPWGSPVVIPGPGTESPEARHHGVHPG